MREKRHPWGYSAFERLKVVDFGDLEFPPGESEDMVNRVIDNVESIHASGKKTLCIGLYKEFFCLRHEYFQHYQ